MKFFAACFLGSKHAPTYNTTYSPGDNISTATWNAAPDTQLLLNLPLSPNTDPNPAIMTVRAPDGSQIGNFDYNGADSNTTAFVIVYNGLTYRKGIMANSAGSRMGALKLTYGDVTISQ